MQIQIKHIPEVSQYKNTSDWSFSAPQPTGTNLSGLLAPTMKNTQNVVQGFRS